MKPTRPLKHYLSIASLALICAVATGPAAEDIHSAPTAPTEDIHLTAAKDTHSAAKDIRFARVQHNESRQPQSLQIAITRYVAENDVIVDLIGAVHIGERDYYAALNERFAKYDALLYELIAAPGKRVTRDSDGTRNRGILSGTQTAMKDALGLAYQLDEIDYDARNFVHADLSREELAASMDERGESLYVYFWRIFYASMDEYVDDPLGLKDWKMLAGIFSGDAQVAMRTTLAYELATPGRIDDILGGESGSALIDDRNQRAIEVLRRQLDRGAKRVGIFYGVGHMDDFDHRLVDELGLKRDSVEWLDAWDLRPNNLATEPASD